MVKSMTGYGRHEASDADHKVTVEMRSVNHRYLDLNMRMPKKFNRFEADIRNVVKTYAVRGKIDLFISYEDLSESDTSLHYNEHIAREYMTYLERMKEDFGLDSDVHVSVLARMPEVLTMEEKEADEKELWRLLKEALEGACQEFVAARILEGENLKNDLLGKLEGLTDSVSFIEVRAPQILGEYGERLLAKVAEILGDTKVEESRIASEVVLYADRICTDEELVRLRSHIDGMKQVLEIGDKDIGHKLDFIAQEMNREANTILSKTKDIAITNHGITLKTEIEKIREQVQNIE